MTGVAAICKISLPHGAGFTLISRVTEINSDGTVFAEFDYTGRERLDLSDHFPGQPIFPGTLLLEAMAQTAIQCAQIIPELRNQVFLLLGIEKCRFRQQILPGGTITLETKICRLHKNVGKSKCKAYINGQIAGEATIIFGWRDNEPPV